jgi:GNAT superfamily N-acetyltransferase
MTILKNVEYHQGRFSILTDRKLLNINFIHDYLCNQSYWAQGRSREVVEKSIQNSLCFGLFEGKKQVGFARIVSDYVTFAWLCDVFIAESYRGQGLGKWLVKSVISHPEIEAVKHVLLATSDAHELYRKYGDFKALRAIDKWMVRYIEI